MPTLAQLRVLVAVVDTGSFTQAATALGISQSAVSHALAALEREGPGPLVDRSGGASPTALAHRLLPHARSALASADAFAAEQAAFAGRADGTVRLAAVPTVCQGLLPRLLRDWSTRLPDVRVQVFEGDDDEMPRWLEVGTVDAAILVDPRPVPDGGRVVARDDYRAIVRRDHPYAEEQVIDLAELGQDGLLVSQGGCEAQVRRLHADADLSFRPAQHVRELATLVRMVAEGIGVSIMPSLGGAMLPPELVMVPLAPTRTRELVLAGPSQRPWHPLVRTLVEATDPADTTGAHPL